MKLRSKWNGERRIRWAFGKPDLWRAFNLSKSVEVYLTEGESDAITLIDEGMEHPGYSCVVALPSASTFKPSWAKRFARKRVALCFDNDRAGEEARDKVAGHLDGVAAEIKAIDWEAVA
ncbi:MAG: toprim domain-containing protein [Verrucomicrobiota bacterium]